MVNNMNIKKIFSALTLLTLIGGGILVSVPSVQAAISEKVLNSCIITESGAALDTCVLDDECKFDENSKCGVCCLLQTLYSVTNWIFVILVGVASLFVILGAMNLLISGGSPEKVSSGRQYIMFAAIGLAVGLLAKAVPAIVKLIVK
jgi:hypothetical protein